MEVIVNSPINPNDVFRLIDSGTAGSVVFHYAVVRAATEGKTMDSIEFRMAGDIEDCLRELQGLSDEIRTGWEVDDVLLIRATGKLKAGDVMSLVAVSSPHRQAAFGACSYGVERLKQMKTIAKHEVFSID
jgi:molybdopterin synthase catalytic subunit